MRTKNENKDGPKVATADAFSSTSSFAVASCSVLANVNIPCRWFMLVSGLRMD